MSAARMARDATGSGARTVHVPDTFCGVTMSLDQALLALNDRLGHEVTVWVEVAHEQPLLIVTGPLENWSHETTATGTPLLSTGQAFDLYGHYSIGDARFDLSDAPVETVTERTDGLTFRVAGGARLVVTWMPKIEGDPA